MRLPRAAPATRWVQVVAQALNGWVLIVGCAGLSACVRQESEIRTLPAQPPTRRSARDANSQRYRVVVTEMKAPAAPQAPATQAPATPAPATPAPAAVAPGAEAPAIPPSASAAFPVVVPPAWGLALRVESVHTCRVTETQITERELVTHFSPTWVLYVSGFAVMGSGFRLALDDADEEIYYPMIISGALLLVTTSLIRTDAVEPLPVRRAQHVSTEPCGTTSHGPHRLTFGPSTNVRRALVPASGEQFLPGVSLEEFKSVFLDGDPVEVVHGAAGLDPPPPRSR